MCPECRELQRLRWEAELREKEMDRLIEVEKKYLRIVHEVQNS